MKRGKLRTKALFGFTVFASMIAVLISASLGFLYENSFEEETRQTAAGYARIAAQIIDGDRIAGYLETGERDDYYYEIQTFLNSAQANAGIQYFYVVTLEEEGFVYVWDTDSPDIWEDYFGAMDPYKNNEKERALAEMQPNPPAELIVEDDPEYGYLATVYAPVFNSAGEPVALVGVDISMPNLEKTIWASIGVIVADVLLVVGLFTAVFFAYIRKNIVDPISKLNISAQEMVDHLESEEQFTIDIHSNDEIEKLAKSFETMYTEVHDYIRQLERVTSERERIGAELNVAKKIQAAMLPSIFPAFPNHPQFDIYADMSPAKEVGGDFYDFFLIDDTHLGIVMADVSGKGIPAALFMVVSKVLLNQRCRVGGSPAETLAMVNNMLCENNRIEMFVTVWLGILDISTGKITAANAGHEYPVIQRTGGSYELLKDRHGFVLAGMEGVGYHNYEIELHKGDRLFLYTDGVPEATNSANALFGTERMLAALNSNTAAGCKEVLEQVRNHVDAFVQEAPQFDDLTMLCLEYKGE